MPKLPVVRDLVDEAEPGSDVGNILGLGEILDGVEVFGEWFHRRRRDFEAGELHLLLTKLELVRVEDDPCVARELQVIDGPPPVSLHVLVVVDGVVDAALLAHEVREDVVESSVVSVARADEALRVAAVAVSAPGCGEGGEVAVLLS